MSSNKIRSNILIFHPFLYILFKNSAASIWPAPVHPGQCLPSLRPDAPTPADAACVQLPTTDAAATAVHPARPTAKRAGNIACSDESAASLNSVSLWRLLSQLSSIAVDKINEVGLAIF